MAMPLVFQLESEINAWPKNSEVQNLLIHMVYRVVSQF